MVPGLKATRKEATFALNFAQQTARSSIKIRSFYPRPLKAAQFHSCHENESPGRFRGRRMQVTPINSRRNNHRGRGRSIVSLIEQLAVRHFYHFTRIRVGPPQRLALTSPAIHRSSALVHEPSRLISRRIMFSDCHESISATSGRVRRAARAQGER